MFVRKIKSVVLYFKLEDTENTPWIQTSMQTKYANSPTMQTSMQTRNVNPLGYGFKKGQINTNNLRIFSYNSRGFNTTKQDTVKTLLSMSSNSLPIIFSQEIFSVEMNI